MSVVVYRDGVMASDTRGWSGETCPIGTRPKCHLVDGMLVGAVADRPGLTDRFFRWVRHGRLLWNTSSKEEQGASAETEDDDVWKRVGGLIVLADGSADFYDGSLMPSRVRAPYYTLGSGSKYALGALEMGADARRAVAVACVLDPYCAEPIHSVSMLMGEPDGN